MEKSKGQWKVKQETHNITEQETHIIEYSPNYLFEREVRAVLDACYERAYKDVSGEYGRKQSVQIGKYKIHCTIEMERVFSSIGQVAYESQVPFIKEGTCLMPWNRLSKSQKEEWEYIANSVIAENQTSEGK